MAGARNPSQEPAPPDHGFLWVLVLSGWQVVQHQGRCPDLPSHPYIYMRWKERCFLNNCQDCGLTIAGGWPLAPAACGSGVSGCTLHWRARARPPARARQRQARQSTLPHPCPPGLGAGFYYIQLNRQTGRLRGLYYDPSSSPFQASALQPPLPPWPGAAAQPSQAAPARPASAGLHVWQALHIPTRMGTGVQGTGWGAPW